MKNGVCKVVSVLLAVAMVLTMSSCTFYERKNNHIAYYSNIGNYVQATGTVSEIKTTIHANDNSSSLFLTIEDTDYDFLYNVFEITGDNWTLVQERGILEKLHEGDRVEFVATPIRIGPEGFRPIVELSVNGEELLSLKEGYNNYIEYIKSRSIFDF